MQSISLIFNSFFINPILNVLLLFFHLFRSAGLPGAFGFSIVALTVSIRLLLHPFFRQQLETTKKMQDIKPHLDKLNIKHKKDQKKLQEEQLKLYQQAGINPAAGCLFMIIQIPVFIALYQTLQLFFNGKMAATILHINKVVYAPFLKVTSIDPWFLGINLAASPKTAHNVYYYLIPVITAILQYLQVQTSTAMIPQSKPEPKKADGKEESSSEDFQKAMNTQMKFVFPIMIGWFSLSLPVGLSLYWNIFSLFSIIQYYQMKSHDSQDVKAK